MQKNNYVLQATCVYSSSMICKILLSRRTLKPTQFIVSLKYAEANTTCYCSTLILAHTLRFQWQMETTDHRLFLFHK